MITSPTKSFYVIRAQDEAAEYLTSLFSEGVMGDITDVVVLSKDFKNDIEPILEVDISMDAILANTNSEANSVEHFNPLFIPSTAEALDEALDTSDGGETVTFNAMNGNPYALKSIEIFNETDKIAMAIIGYHQFQMPDYQTIVSSQTSERLN